MDIKTYEIMKYESEMLHIHRARTQVVSFKALYKGIVKKGYMNMHDFRVLEASAMVSSDYNDMIKVHDLVLKLGVVNG